MTPDAANVIFLALVLIAAVLGLVLLVVTVGLERGLEERRGDARQGGRGSEKGYPR